MTTTRKVNAHSNLGTLQQGDVVLGERTSGTTGLFTVPDLSGGAVDSVNGQTGTVVLTATDIIPGLTSSASELNILDGATLTTTELNYVDGVTSAIQTQLDGKAASLGADDNYVTDAEKVKLGNLSGTNTGDQTSIVGITGTKAQFNTAVSDGDIVYTDSLGTGVATFLATPSSVNLAAALTDETGSGAAVFATSPTLVTPILGTPTSGTLTNCTGLTAGGKLSSGISVNRSANQSVNSATFTKVQLNTENYDTQGTFDSVTNYRWTPNIAGKYLIIGSIYIQSLADQKLLEVVIYKNGSASPVFNGINQSIATTGDALVQCVGILSMNGTTDYLELYAYHENGSAINITSLCNMTGEFLGV